VTRNMGIESLDLDHYGDGISARMMEGRNRGHSFFSASGVETGDRISGGAVVSLLMNYFMLRISRFKNFVIISTEFLDCKVVSCIGTSPRKSYIRE
jgi:hypothetical protein